jgi:hypothetical protein
MVLSSAYVGQPNRCCMMRSTRDTPKGWRRSEHLQAAPWHDHLHHLCEQLFRVAPALLPRKFIAGKAQPAWPVPGGVPWRSAHGESVPDGLAFPMAFRQ